MTRLLVVCCFSLLLAGVSGDDVTVTEMKGNNVTLPINPEEIKKAERLLWKFKNTTIATIDLEEENSQAKYPDEEIQKSRGRLNLERKTGSLTINNITTEDTGEYQLEIKTNKTPDYKPLKTFSVTVTEEESVSRKEEQFVILQTNSPTQSDDVIEWKFKNTSIALFNRTANKYSYPDAEKKDRLQMESSGSLTIQQLKTEDSGPYDVYINNSNRFIHKRFNLTVIESNSWYFWPGFWLLIGLLIELLIGFVLTAIYFKYIHKKT